MSAGSFLAVVFDSSAEAERALDAIGALAGEKDLAVRDLAVVMRTARGRVELQQGREIAAGEALVGGGTTGLVAGLLLGFPVAGALLGLLGGGLLGIGDRGIPDNRMRALGEDLQLGQAVLCVLVDAPEVEPMRDLLGRYGDVVEVELPS